MKKVLLVAALGLALAPTVGAQAPEPPPPDPLVTSAPAVDARSGPAFDVGAATRAYLARVPADQRARSDAYFEGGYWLQLWDFLFGVAVALLLLGTGMSARMRDRAERVTRRTAVHTFAYWVQYLLLTAIVGFPLGAYEGFYREHQYGLSNQTFGAWFKDQAIGLGVGMVLGGFLVVALVGVVRRLGASWWVWGAVLATAFAALTIVIAPVFIAPLFNTYKKLEDPRVREPILSLARANGIGVSEVYQFDASRQSKRVSANVSGFLGTERISLNDNLLNRCTPAQVQTVMGHEMGHYVLNHVYKTLLFLGVAIVVGFAWLNQALGWSLARWGTRWGLRGPTDVAALPLALLILSIYGFVATPFVNSWTRMEEYEADIFGLNAARQPDAEAEVDLLLGEYRKLDPGPIEEWIFFDHPSGRVRIEAAMRWKAENTAGR